jgi:succinate dehydrogenase / fumarate reductase, cytochrome b subunit
MTQRDTLIPKTFIMRRLHSLMGLWLTLFLLQHLFINSQAALFIGDDGLGFIKAANDIHSLPYLPLIEAILLGIPFLLHAWLGVQYLFTSKINSFPKDGSSPSLTRYPRNHAYTWQRITSWILLFAIVAHVVQMRFLENPASAKVGTQTSFVVRLEADSGLATLSNRLGFELLDSPQVEEIKQKANLADGSSTDSFVVALEKKPLHVGQVFAVTHDFGTAELLMVRETFKEPVMIALYTLFVFAACFHGLNGLWTFMISWGITLSVTSQRWMRKVATGIMILITCLGLAAIWGTYWINLIN